MKIHINICLNIHMNIYMVSWWQEQNPLMSLLFFLKCSHSTCSGELNFYRIFMPYFAFIRSWSSNHFKLKFLNRRCQKKSEYFFTFGYNSGWKKTNILTSRLYKVTKNAISPQWKIRSFGTENRLKAEIW